MAEFKVLEPRKQDVEYYPDHNGNFFYIRVNDTGRNFRLVKAPVSDPRSANWQEVVPQRADVMLDDTDFFKHYYVLSERENGLPQMQVTDLALNFRSPLMRAIRMPTVNMTPRNSAMDTSRSLLRARCSSTTWPLGNPRC